MADMPPEFSSEAVRKCSSPREQLFHDFHSDQEPGASLQNQGLTFSKDKASPTHLNESDAHYYNTLGSATEYWKGKNLPMPTKNIRAMRADLQRWGYCLVSEALSAKQLEAMRARVVEQAAGERDAGIALWLNASATGSNTQFVTTLLNKGQAFEGALNFDPQHVQAGPLLEQLLGEALGGDFLVNSFQAIIAEQHGYPQALHQDLNGSGPFRHPDAPLLVTAMFMLDDVGPHNGGTLVIPGSHTTVSQGSAGQALPDLPPPINVAAPAGCVMLFDHRLLHGTGVNWTPNPRHILIAGFHRTWMRTQEAWLLSAAPEVVARASPRLLQRLGFSAHTIGTVEGHGLGASGNPHDEFSSISGFRQALDKSAYMRVGILRPLTSEGDSDLMQTFTFRTTASGRRAAAKARKFGLMDETRLDQVDALAGGAAYAKRGTGNNDLHSRL